MITRVPSRHGVLSCTGPDMGKYVTLTIQNTEQPLYFPEYPTRLSQFCEMALYHGLSHLWVMPDVHNSLDHAFFDEATGRFDLWPSWLWEEREDAPLEEGVINQLVSATGCRKPKGGQKWFSICFPTNCQWSWYYDEIPASELIETVNTMERSLGVAIGAGPTTAGIKLFETVGKTSPVYVPGLDTMPYAQASSSLIWQAPVSRLKKGRFVHKADKNSAFLRACQEVQTGVGNAIHIDGSFPLASKVPGLWRITAHTDNGDLLPPALWSNAEWVTTPTLKMLNYLKMPFEVQEGYYWKDTQKALKPWAEFLWTKRQELKPIHEGAYGGIKDIAAKTVGLFNAEGLLKDYRNPQSKTRWKYRPDYWHTVVDEARAQMFYNIVKFAHLDELDMVDIDALFYVTEEEDLTKAIPGLLDHKDSLGGYKHVWTLPLDTEVQAALDIKGMNLRIGALNDIAEERGL